MNRISNPILKNATNVISIKVETFQQLCLILNPMLQVGGGSGCVLMWVESGVLDRFGNGSKSYFRN